MLRLLPRKKLRLIYKKIHNYNKNNNHKRNYNKKWKMNLNLLNVQDH